MRVIFLSLIAVIAYTYLCYTHPDAPYADKVVQYTKPFVSLLPGVKIPEHTMEVPEQTPQTAVQPDEEMQEPTVQGDQQQDTVPAVTETPVEEPAQSKNPVVMVMFHNGESVVGKIIQRKENGDFVMQLPEGKIVFAGQEIKSITDVKPGATLPSLNPDIITNATDPETPEDTSPDFVDAVVAERENYDGPIQWIDSLPKGLERAAQQKKLVLVDFSTEWCGWCKKMDKDTFNDVAVRTYLNEHFICVRLDGDKENALVNQYRVQGYPTIAFMKADGTVIQQVPGYVPADRFLPMAKAAQEMHAQQ